jgi:HAD superfamily hydrolase (TIGR01509 family)
VAASGLTDVLTEDERTGDDPHLVLQAVHRAAKRADVRRHFKGVDFEHEVGVLEEALTRGEFTAALDAWPTPDVDAFIGSLADEGMSLAVVTNNSPRVARSYLDDKGLGKYFDVIHGRTSDPGLMKPHPRVLKCALEDLALPPESAVMIGDTPTDLEAATQAGVGFIGYGRTTAWRKRLRDAGAKVVLGGYAPLLGDTGEEGAAHEPTPSVGGATARQ